MFGIYIKHLSIFLMIMGVTAVMCNSAASDEIEENAKRQRNFNAVQYVYKSGVPHTDSRGKLLTKYQAGKSFFPIAMWGAPVPGKVFGEEIDWKVLKEAGFNTVWPWASPIKEQLKAGAANNMKIVVMGEIKEADLKEVKNDACLYGNVWMDEPIGGVGSRDMDKLFNDFKKYRETAHKIAPELNIFINDAPWIMEPATSWWIKFNTEGEISCHDNYPVMNKTSRSNSIGAEPNGIPQTVSLAVGANKEKKPVWLIVGAFDQPGEYGGAFPFRYPSPEQLRACVYSGIIHGATGIVYFIWDTYVPRDGGVIGMSPSPKTAYVPNPQKEGYTKPTPATPIQQIKARSLWETSTQINRELKELAPAILSPTAGDDFKYTLDITGTSPSQTPIRCLLKQDPEGGYILFTVNIDDSCLKVKYTMPSQIKSAEVLYENRQPEKLENENKSFTLSYEPFDTHIIRIKI